MRKRMLSVCTGCGAVDSRIASGWSSSTWTASVRHSYGGTVTWKAM